MAERDTFITVSDNDYFQLDANKLNNEIDNLVVLTRAQHARHHYEEEKMINNKRDLWGINYGRD